MPKLIYNFEEIMWFVADGAKVGLDSVQLALANMEDPASLTATVTTDVPAKRTRKPKVVANAAYKTA